MPRPLHLSWFGPLASSFLVPAKTTSAVARRRGQGRPPGRRAQRAFLDGGEHGRTLFVAGAIARPSRAKRAALLIGLLALCCCGAAFGGVRAQGVEPALPTMRTEIAEASRRSGLSAAWIEAVALEESGGAPRAVSPKGAMGVMQIMPRTWRALRADLGLGSDPFEPRDNLVAGAVYLRKMLDRFGVGGFLAAYNAGPGRYQDFVEGRRPLPTETVRYVARVRARIGLTHAPASLGRSAAVRDWRVSELFVGAHSDDLRSRIIRADHPLFIDRSSELVP